MSDFNSFKKQFQDIFNAHVSNYLDSLFLRSQENLVNDGKIDTGNLLKSGITNKTYMGGEIVYSAPYSDNVENGRLEGSMPPVEPIQVWVERKLKIRPPMSKQVAFSIAKSIKERGIEPSFFFDSAFIDTNKDFKVKVVK